MNFLSLLAIVKDENDFLEEFVEFYKDNGIEHFYFYDNESEVPISETLRDYLDICTITEIKGVAQQIPAYNHFLKNFKHQTEWIAVFDVDEYVYLKKHKNLIEFVNDYENKGDSIGINWVIFGNGNHIHKPKEGGILENYIYSEGVQHKNIKSISRTSAIRRFDHPHHPKLKWFKKQVNAKGNRIKGAINEEDCIDVVQLNHYFTKSLEEYKDKLYKKRLSDTGLIRADNEENLKWMLTEPERCSVFLDDGLLKKSKKVEKIY